MAADELADLRHFIGDSTEFTVRVTPNASANKIKLDSDSAGQQMLRIYVTCAPEDGKANKAVVKLLSKALKLPKSALKVLRGHKSRTKTIQFS